MSYSMNCFFRNTLPIALCLVALSISIQAQEPIPNRLSIYPHEIATGSARQFQRIVVQAHYDDGRTEDVTAKCSFDVQPSNLGRLESEAFVPQEDGKGSLEIKMDGLTGVIPVTVANAKSQPPVAFRNEVIQVLTKSGCNTGKCHGAATGKDGFRLSLFGYDPK